MEHGVLTDLSLAARENVLQTYRDLAFALPDTREISRKGYVRLEGTWPLSFCHYAADFRSDRDASAIARELREDSRNRHGLWAFLLPGDEPPGLAAALLEEGFSMRQCLCQFATRQVGHAELSLREADGPDERMHIGKFMAGQFFPFAGEESRVLVSRSTSSSLSRLLYVGDYRNPQAAMMISRSEHAAGLYNLCVAPECRGLGIGSSMVMAAANLAHRASIPLTLQCHGSLRKWYEKLNFDYAGTFHAFFAGGHRPDFSNEAI